MTALGTHAAECGALSRDIASLCEVICVVFAADDDLLVREDLNSLIRSAGTRVETFASAEEFLNNKRLDAPGCLVLDVRLPGMSGLDLQRELAKANVQLPIVFITGHGSR